MNIKHLGGYLEGSAEFNRHYLRTIFIVLLGSFALGAIPITYGLRLTPESSQSMVTIPGEATLWKSLGER